MARLNQAQVGYQQALSDLDNAVLTSPIDGIVSEVNVESGEMAGIVVNNAIVLVDYINTRRKRGEERSEAIVNAGPIRLRPILMTTLTIVKSCNQYHSTALVVV